MQISISMHQRITSTGLNTELGKVGNPAEAPQRIPKAIIIFTEVWIVHGVHLS